MRSTAACSIYVRHTILVTNCFNLGFQFQESTLHTAIAIRFAQCAEKRLTKFQRNHFFKTRAASANYDFFFGKYIFS